MVIEPELSALGGSDAGKAIESLVGKGPEVVAEVMAFRAGERDVDTPHEGTRAFFEDRADLLWRLAREYPREFEAELGSRPELRTRFDVISAMGPLDDDVATGWLLDALKARDGSCRCVALCQLLERRAPEVVPRLRDLLGDRDHLVRFEAACALRVYGTPDDVPALEHSMESAQIGGREYARDSIEAICARSDVDLPPSHPGPRLTSASVSIGDADEPIEEIATRSQVVAEGEKVARTPTATLRAPREGVLIGIDLDGATLTATVRDITSRQPDSGH